MKLTFKRAEERRAWREEQKAAKRVRKPAAIALRHLAKKRAAKADRDIAKREQRRAAE